MPAGATEGREMRILSLIHHSIDGIAQRAGSPCADSNRAGSGGRLRVSTHSIAGLAVPLFLMTARVGLAQVVDTALWVTNGGVSSVSPYGRTIYIGGEFTRAGP